MHINGNTIVTINPKSLANLNPKARFMGKVRFNTTLRPETITWLQSGGNASQRIEDLVEAARGKKLKFSDRNSDPATTKENDRETIARLTAEVEKLKKFEETIGKLRSLLSESK